MKNELSNMVYANPDKYIQDLIDTYRALDDVKNSVELGKKQVEYDVKRLGTKEYFKDDPRKVFEKLGHIAPESLTIDEQKFSKNIDERLKAIEQVYGLLEFFDFFKFHDEEERESNLKQSLKFQIPFKEIEHSLTIELEEHLEFLKQQLESKLLKSAFDPKTILDSELERYGGAEVSIFDEMKDGLFIPNMDQIEVRHRVIWELAGIKYYHFLNDLKNNDSRLEGHADRNYFLVKNRKKLKWTGNKKALGTIFASLKKEGLITGGQVDIQRMIIENFEDFSLSYLEKNFAIKKASIDFKYENDPDVSNKIKEYSLLLKKSEEINVQLEKALDDLNKMISKREKSQNSRNK